MKGNLLSSVLALICIVALAMFFYEKTRADDALKASQSLFDLDQQMIALDVNAYQALFHCYDKPTTCNIYNPNGEADKFERESMKLAKQKQTLITQYPSLVPERYKAAWGVK